MAFRQTLDADAGLRVRPHNLGRGSMHLDMGAYVDLAVLG